MKLANIGGRAVVLTDSGAVDVHEASRGAYGPKLANVYENWTDFSVWARAEDLANGRPWSEDELGPVSPDARQVFAVGLNYRDHTAEAGFVQPSTPMIFTKFASSLAAPYGSIELSSEHVDWEVEMVVVIGQTATRIEEGAAWDHVAGLAIGQDYSDRHLQMQGAPPQFSLGKSYPGYAPVGPYLTTLDEIEDPADLDLTCSIDGDPVQTGNTSDMVFDVPYLLTHLSSVCTLSPGDLIFTGTPPGVGMGRTPVRYLNAGEVVESSIEGLGTIRQVCVSGTLRAGVS